MKKKQVFLRASFLFIFILDNVLTFCLDLDKARIAKKNYALYQVFGIVEIYNRLENLYSV